jgi:signal transduction histidine kinase
MGAPPATPTPLDRLARLGRAVAGERDLPTIFSLAVECCAAGLGATDVFLFVSGDGASGSLTLRAIAPDRPADHRDPLQRQAADCAVQALRQEPDAAGRAEFQDTFLLPAPLFAGNRPAGCLVAVRGSPARRGFDRQEHQFLRAVADYVATAIQSAQLFASHQHQVRELVLLSDVANDCADLGLDPFLPTVNERLCRAMDLDLSALLYLDSQSSELVWGAGYRRGGDLNLMQRRFPIDRSFEGRAVQARHWRRGTLEDIPDPERRTLMSGWGLAHFAAVPMMVRDRIIGVLTAARSDRVISDNELRLLNAVALQVAVAVDNARLLAESQRRASDLALVQSVGTAMAQSLDQRAILRETIDRLFDALECEGIRIYRERDGALEVVMQRGPIAESAGTDKLRTDSAVVRRARHLGRALDFDAESVDEPLRSAFLAHGVGRYAVMPLWIRPAGVGDADGSGSMGILAVVRRAHRAFGPSELGVLNAVGGQLAVALRNAELFEETRQRAEDLATVNAQLRQTQEQFVRRERLAALGGLAALVAHEIRNPLGVIVNSLGFLEKSAELEGDARRAYDIIREETGRLDQIVTDMLDYTRPTEPKLVPGSLERVLRQSLASATTAERARGTRLDEVQSEVIIARDVPLVPMDDRLLHQALINLLSNAYQSLNGAGTVRLEARLDTGGAHAIIGVSDNGPGLTSEARSRLWEPFYTTKAKGSGLGLAMVKRIVDSHRGEISVETVTGSGTRFQITLPVATGSDAVAGEKGGSAS